MPAVGAVLFANVTYVRTIAPDGYVWSADNQCTIASLTAGTHMVKKE